MKNISEMRKGSTGETTLHTMSRSRLIQVAAVTMFLSQCVAFAADDTKDFAGDWRVGTSWVNEYPNQDKKYSNTGYTLFEIWYSEKAAKTPLCRMNTIELDGKGGSSTEAIYSYNLYSTRDTSLDEIDPLECVRRGDLLTIRLKQSSRMCSFSLRIKGKTTVESFDGTCLLESGRRDTVTYMGLEPGKEIVKLKGPILFPPQEAKR